MSEEILGGNQTTTEEVQTQEPIEQQQQEQTESIENNPATTQEQNYFEIKYNKEPVKVSYEEAPTYIQKGMNYDKLQEKLQALENDPRLSFVENMANRFGMTVPDYLEAVKQQEEQERINELIQQGVSEDLAQEMLENRRFREQFETERKAKEADARFKQEADELFQEFPNIKPDQIPAEVWQIKEQRGLSLLDAYLRVSYKSLGQQKEQEAIQKLQQNARSTPGSLGAGAEHKAGYANLSAADKKALRERVLRGENIEF